MKCIQALAWFCFLRFLLSMQHIYLFVYFWVVGEFWVTWFFMPQFQIWRLAIPQPLWKPCKQNPQCRSLFVFVCLGLWVSRNWGNFKMNCGGKGNRRHCRSSCCCMESLVSNTRLGVTSLNWLDIFFTRVNWIDLFLSAQLLSILLVGVLKHKSFWSLSSFLWKGCCICDHLQDETLHRVWDGPSGFSACNHWGVLQRKNTSRVRETPVLCVHDISIFYRVKLIIEIRLHVKSLCTFRMIVWICILMLYFAYGSHFISHLLARILLARILSLQDHLTKHAGTCTGCMRPLVLVRSILLFWHCEQDFIHLAMSFRKFGQ